MSESCSKVKDDRGSGWMLERRLQELEIHGAVQLQFGPGGYVSPQSYGCEYKCKQVGAGIGFQVVYSILHHG